MTSDEIRSAVSTNAIDTTDRMALWEIAYQLAIMNKRNASGDEEAVQKMLNKVSLGSPDHDKRASGEVRGDYPLLTAETWRILYNSAIQDRDHLRKTLHVAVKAKLGAQGELDVAYEFLRSISRQHPDIEDAALREQIREFLKASEPANETTAGNAALWNRIRRQDSPTYADRILHAETHHFDHSVPPGRIRATFDLTNEEYQRLLDIQLDLVSGPSGQSDQLPGSHPPESSTDARIQPLKQVDS